MRCVILQDEPRCFKFFGKLNLNFFCLDEDGYVKLDYCIELFQKITNNLCILRECIHSAKIWIAAFIMGQYPVLQNGRTEGFKVDWYPFKLGTCCMLPEDIPSFIRQASCMRISPKLHPCSDLQRGLWFHPLGVIFYIYTTKNFCILSKTTMSLVLP